MENIKAINNIIDNIRSMLNKLGLTNQVSSSDTQKRDEVVKSVHKITIDLRYCIAHLDNCSYNTTLAQVREQIQTIKNELVEVQNQLQTAHIVLAKAHVEGGDNRDNAHLTMLELEFLVEQIKSIKF